MPNVINQSVEVTKSDNISADQEDESEDEMSVDDEIYQSLENNESVDSESEVEAYSSKKFERSLNLETTKQI